MSAIVRSSSSLRARSGLLRTATLTKCQHGEAITYRNFHSLGRLVLGRQSGVARLPPPEPYRSPAIWPLYSQFLPKNFIVQPSLRASRTFHHASSLFQQPKPKDDIRDPPRQETSAESESAKASTDEPSAENEKKSSSGDGEEGSKAGEESEDKSNKEKKKDEPPPPPHGDKSPYQVFMDTLRSEFKASKEWNEGTKALASSAHEFTQNESLKRARSAYTAASDAATSTTGKVLKSTGKAIGQGAAWTWDTLPVRGIRASVTATASGLEKITRPVRETKAYKNVRDVIDDGSSSRYGGWTEKEQRRKRREDRELEEAARTGRPIRRAEKMEEDPE